MAYHSFQIADDLIWRAPLYWPSSELAEALREAFTTHRAHFHDIIRLNETPPDAAMTLEQWAHPTRLASLMAIYSDHIYRNHLTQPREAKPLVSLWAQWYLGLLAPPLMLALLTQPQAIAVTPSHIHVEFHETGRAACFWLNVQEDHLASALSARERIEKLVTECLQPVVKALEATGDINARLIWSNTGYLINWCLGEWKGFLGEEMVNALRKACFFEKQLRNGQDNPLYRTVVLREGLLVRRTCCQRYRLPDVQQCGDCTLK
ncbi:siderophore-iron reductase FhuF [Franconibacter daqui]|uniref:siderophore-iron reductase FhuF n=1 Tax=Franconibacter daqui TaxID=2047724 RepID=UPI002DB65747|nr:siderophore-iron reductase FhuF [Franconibacter daqui]MEB5923689.1 siderophore-iron reductase FhuF [Franconibacter daqui]